MHVVSLRMGAADPIIATHATRFHERLLGRWAPGALDAVLIRTSSVHTVGLHEPISLVGLDDGFVVVATRVLKPNRFVWWRRARHILELPDGTETPQLGERLVLTNV